MRYRPNSSIGWLTALLLVLTGMPALAGGLVDTGPDVFAAAGPMSANITNPWWTLPAGANFLYFAEDGEDCVWNLVEVQGTGKLPALGLSAPYAGTDVRIVLDRGWVDEDCSFGGDFAAFMATNPDAEEVTYDWYAQDTEQNIWYMGEDTYDGVDKAGSFVAGCDGAEAGIVLLGTPSKGAFYSQEFYEGEAEDWGKVVNFKPMGDLVCMKTKEWSPLEHGAVEHKWYCLDETSGTGQLTKIEELKGKTLIWDLVATDVEAPPPPAVDLPVSPAPTCPLVP